MNTAEGDHEIQVCEDCAKTLNHMKDNQYE
jgi:hypothetical protein